MKIILAKDMVKREIVAPFAICASRADLEALVLRIQEALEDGKFHYGWFTVHPVPAIPLDGPNTPPLPWTDGTSSVTK